MTPKSCCKQKRISSNTCIEHFSSSFFFYLPFTHFLTLLPLLELTLSRISPIEVLRSTQIIILMHIICKINMFNREKLGFPNTVEHLRTIWIMMQICVTAMYQSLNYHFPNKINFAIFRGKKTNNKCLIIFNYKTRETYFMCTYM
jgi:hypothetical protein